MKHAPVDVEPLLLTMDQAARALNVSLGLTKQLVYRGEIGSVIVGRRGRRVPVDEVRRWIREHTEGGDTAA